MRHQVTVKHRPPPPTPLPSFFPQAPTRRKVLHLTLVTLWCRQTDRRMFTRLPKFLKWIDKRILLPMGLHAHCFTVQVSTIIQKNQPLVCKVKFGDSRVLDFDQKTFKSQLEQVNGSKGSGINDRLGYFCQKVILQGMFRILFFQTETDAGYLHL